MRWVAGECFEVDFLENKIYRRYAKKGVNIYIYGTRQDEDKGRLTAMPSWDKRSSSLTIRKEDTQNNYQ